MELGCRTALGGEEVVTAHLETVFAGVADVLLVFGVDVVAALGGLDVNELDFTVVPKLSPVDITLMLGHVDSVKLCLLGVDSLTHFGFGRIGLDGIGVALGVCGLGGRGIFLSGGRGLSGILLGGCGLGGIIVLGGSCWCLSGGLASLLVILLVLFLVRFLLVLIFLAHALARGLGDISMLWRTPRRDGAQREHEGYQQ